MSTYVSRGLHGKLVQELGIAITSNQLPPGTRIDIDELGEKHDVSLTVVREAIRVLITKGLVDARPKRGTLVRDRSQWNVLDSDVIGWMYSEPNELFLESLDEVRRIIEPAGARIAAKRRTEENLAQMHSAFAALTTPHENVEETVAADVAFHHAITVATHNEILQHLTIVTDAGLRARDMLVMSADSDLNLPNHHAVLDAIQAGDPDRAEAAMQTLLERAADHQAAVRARA